MIKDRLQLNIRLDGYQELLEATRQAASTQGISLNTFVINALKTAVAFPQDEIPQQSQTLPLEAILEALTPRLDTLLDNRLEQLENRLDTLLDTQLALQSEIDLFKKRLDSLTPDAIAPKATITDTRSPNATAKVSQGDVLYVCPHCGVVGGKGVDFIKDTQSTARNPKLKCVHCGKSRVSAAFKPSLQEVLKTAETWEEKASNFVEGMNWL